MGEQRGRGPWLLGTAGDAGEGDPLAASGGVVQRGLGLHSRMVVASEALSPALHCHHESS